MTFSPHSASDSSFRDPYQLDRLADELASRESTAAYNTNSQLYTLDQPVPEFQEPLPLSHSDPHLGSESFNAEEFLLERRKIALPDLRAELRQYLVALKEELVKLINDDYEAFISLSTDLRDEGARLERLRHPLATLKANVLESKRDLERIQGEIHEKLTSRSKLREEQALLHLLLKISDSVIRLEKLLVILSPDEDLQGPRDRVTVLMHNTQMEDNADAKLRGNRAKHLARVATEYTQLLYHVRKARAENCVFVDMLQWRIDRIQSTLSSDLDQLFAQTLDTLTDPKGENRGTELEKSKWITDLTECLRIYDVLGLWRDAEDVIRREVMRPFIKKTIHPGALAAPPSPIVPNTPFRTVSPESMTSGNIHQIPYTPFTAFVPRQNTYNIDSLSDAPKAHLLEEIDDSLARLYNQLLRFIERDVCRIMSLADKVTLATHTEARTAERDDTSMEFGRSVEETRGFQIMSHVVWEELGKSLMDEIGVVVFAAGSPKEFRQHYETTQAFIRSLELLAPSRHAVEQMRRHAVYVCFERRWQLPVYFQLRWKEIIGTLEDALTMTRLESINLKGDGSFATPQAAAFWIALSGCWSSEIYLPELGHRFWRLTLQILSRYTMWLEESQSSVESSFKGSSTDKPASSPSATRAGTPVSSETPLAESIAADDVLLRHYASAFVDIKLMETNTWRLWHQVVSLMLPGTPEDSPQAEDALRSGLSSLNAFIENLSVKIVAILAKRCYDNLLPVRSIPTQLRMANKRTPTEPSSFVPSILRPLKQFFDGPGRSLKALYFQRYSIDVFTHVTQRYISYLTAIKKAEEPLKRLKKKTRPTFSLFGTSPNVNDDAKDEERIRSQMILDVESFGKDAQSLGVDVDSNPHFASLKEIVYATDPE